jgi:alkylation response protein AidB-like acyl-CoA dehydrogenase
VRGHLFLVKFSTVEHVVSGQATEQKYAEMDSQTGRPQGFQIPSRKDIARDNTLLSKDAKIRLQLAACFAAEACAEAVRFVNDAVGTSPIRAEQPFERYFRDAHQLLQHSSKSSARYGSAGRLMCGLEND